MTRFYKEISGLLGEYWKKDAMKRVEQYTLNAFNECTVENDGAIKWKVNGSYLMDDMCEVLEYAGFLFSRKATALKREAQVHKEIKEYRKNPPAITSEDVAEMRAAFGARTKVVNVITGQVFRV